MKHTIGECPLCNTMRRRNLKHAKKFKEIINEAMGWTLKE